MTFPEITITEEQQERMRACWEAFEDIPTKAVKQIRVKELVNVIKSVRDILGCTAVHTATTNAKEASHGK